MATGAIFVFTVVGTAVAHQTSADVPPAEPVQLGYGLHLLGDGDLMQSMSPGITAAVTRPVKLDWERPVIGPEYPWEGTMHMYGSVIQVSPTDLRVYYACNVSKSWQVNATDDASSACVATSADGGSTWTKPLMPTSPPYPNYTKTNMVFTSEDGWFDTVILLPDGVAPLGAPSGTRFLMAFDNTATDTTKRALQLAVSPDGFAFETLHPPPPLGESFADTSVSLVFDPFTQDFVAYGRDDNTPDQHPDERCGHFPISFNMRSVRGVRRAISPPDNRTGTPSLLNFSVATPVSFAFDRLDPQCLDVYNSAAVIVDPHGAVNDYERAYLAFPSVYLHYGEEENNGIVDVRFAFSRNGSFFRYIDGDRRAYVPRGFGAGQSLLSKGLQPSVFDLPDDTVPARWDSGLVYMYRGVANQPESGTQTLFYFGQQGTHAHQEATTRGVFGIGRVKIIKDRWIGLGADSIVPNTSTNGTATVLTMTTAPVTLPKCSPSSATLSLWMNADVSVGGNVTIAVLNEDGVPVQGFAHEDSLGIMGNRLAAAVRFRRAGAIGNVTSDLGPISRTLPQVQIDFRILPPARLYTWRFACTTV